MTNNLNLPQTITRRRSSSTLCKRTSPAMLALASRFPVWHWRSTTAVDEKLPIAEDSLPTSSPASPTSPEQPRPRALPLSLLLVLSLFPLSTAAVYLSLRTLPIGMSSWPRTIADITQLARDLHGYASSGPWQCLHIVYVMSITSIWKHAWSIPGSVIWNILAGSLFSPIVATLLLTLLTTMGSICSTLLAAPLSPVIDQFFPKMLDMTRSALEGTSPIEKGGPDAKTPAAPLERAWVRLSVLRLIGVVPWSGINLASGVCRISLFDCAVGAFIGVLPWTAVTCQVGSIVRTLLSSPPNPNMSTSDTISSLLFSREIILKLVLLTVLSLLPILGRGWLRDLIRERPQTQADSPTEKAQRQWTVSGILRRSISASRSPSLSSDKRRRARELELEEIIREKHEVEIS